MSVGTDSETGPGEAGAGGGGALLATRPRRLALLASLVWAVIVIAYAVGFATKAPEGRGTAALDLLFFAAVLALPAGLLWLAALLADELARLRAALGGLAAAIPALTADLAATRAVVASEGPVSGGDISRAVREALAEGPRAEEAERLGRLLEGQEEIRAGLRALVERRGARPPVSPVPTPAPDAAPHVTPAPRGAAHPAEPLPAESAEAELRPSWEVLVRALNFPRDATDREGFRALTAANRHSGVAHALRAAEDLLTLLSEVGVYMDDIVLAPADPEAWRRYMAGTRGAEVAAVGGVTDAEVLARTKRLMDGGPVFRDTAQHFLRRFDAILAEFALEADDDALRALIDTRSARAFMLLARLRGRFG